MLPLTAPVGSCTWVGEAGERCHAGWVMRGCARELVARGRASALADVGEVDGSSRAGP